MKCDSAHFCCICRTTILRRQNTTFSHFCQRTFSSSSGALQTLIFCACL